MLTTKVLSILKLNLQRREGGLEYYEVDDGKINYTILQIKCMNGMGETGKTCMS